MKIILLIGSLVVLFFIFISVFGENPVSEDKITMQKCESYESLSSLVSANGGNAKALDYLNKEEIAHCNQNGFSISY